MGVDLIKAEDRNDEQIEGSVVKDQSKGREFVTHTHTRMNRE